MKNNNHKNVDREKRTLKVAIYIRVGSIEQLSNETEQRHFDLKMESSQKEECNVGVKFSYPLKNC
mgnify:CR=1 FL=1